MAKDTKTTSTTFRLSPELKNAVQEVADETDRSLSNAMIWLLRRGIQAYREDGILVEPQREQNKFRVIRKRKE